MRVGNGCQCHPHTTVQTERAAQLSYRRRLPDTSHDWSHRISQPQLRELANLEPAPVIDDPPVENHHNEPPTRRELTARQLAIWKAVQQAKAQGLSLRTISRQLGVHRNTVRKYAHPPTQPTNRPINRVAGRSHQPATRRSD